MRCGAASARGARAHAQPAAVTTSQPAAAPRAPAATASAACSTSGAMHGPAPSHLLAAAAPSFMHATQSRGRMACRAGGGGGRSPMEDVEAFDDGKSRQEQLSGETNTMVSGIVDIDRTPELLAWLFSGWFGKKQDPDTGAKPPASPPGAPSPASSTAARADTATSSSSASSSSSAPEQPSSSGAPRKTEVATIGGGCFWCIEACFNELQGVVRATSGYAGGHVPNPTYKQVLAKNTGHAEVVQVEYDPAVLSYKDILQVFFSMHDPTTPNRQGNDVGPQYRSIIMFHDDQQKAAAQEVMQQAASEQWFLSKPICTQLVPLETFYAAENYHQRYYARNPNAGYCTFVVAPKLQAFRRKYGKKLKQQLV